MSLKTFYFLDEQCPPHCSTRALSQLHISRVLHSVSKFFTILFPGWCTRILWSGSKFPKRILLHSSCIKGRHLRTAYDLIFLLPAILLQFLDRFLFSHHFLFSPQTPPTFFLLKASAALLASHSTQAYLKLLLSGSTSIAGR